MDPSGGRYVALPRPIDVGGNNLIKTARPKACFEQQSSREVATDSRSGDVVFTTGERSSANLVERVLSVPRLIGKASR